MMFYYFFQAQRGLTSSYLMQLKGLHMLQSQPWALIEIKGFGVINSVSHTQKLHKWLTNHHIHAKEPQNRKWEIFFQYK